ncbi:pentapeptide repeat-containing protein [Streptomyces sp. NPDC090083]|uniref:pentapeptide repeat-containing protein n=1 Tax=Streptomyces sp. NPDC090083 TaxID=3365941 RepID=UPI003821E7D4
MAAVIALIFTFVAVHQSQDSLDITEQGQITDRYNAAVSNLGSNAIDVRLGGIYALQRIMSDSPRDQPSIINLLSAYVRVHADAPATHSPRVETRKLDIDAALSVLGYRDPAHDRLTTVDLHGVHLEGANLHYVGPTRLNFRQADLSQAHLAGAQLESIDVSNALLDKADLTEAVLNYAILDNASLQQASLPGADLRNAWLTDARLSCADLRRASFGDATLTNAHLADADLTDAAFREAKASGADLLGTDLTGATFADTDLSDASFANANLAKAHFEGSRLAGAEFGSARLAGADFTHTDITAQQLLTAYPERSTRLPARIAADLRVQKRIADIEEWLRSGRPPQTWRIGCGTPRTDASATPRAGPRPRVGNKGQTSSGYRGDARRMTQSRLPLGNARVFRTGFDTAGRNFADYGRQGARRSSGPRR